MKQAMTRFGSWFEGLRFSEQITVFYGSIVSIIIIILLIATPFIRERRAQNHEADIAQCMRAFDYTRDQCEFIIKHHVMVSP